MKQIWGRHNKTREERFQCRGRFMVARRRRYSGLLVKFPWICLQVEMVKMEVWEKEDLDKGWIGERRVHEGGWSYENGRQISWPYKSRAYWSILGTSWSHIAFTSDGANKITRAFTELFEYARDLRLARSMTSECRHGGRRECTWEELWKVRG